MFLLKAAAAEPTDTRKATGKAESITGSPRTKEMI
jgi:hypothetical protein